MGRLCAVPHRGNTPGKRQLELRLHYVCGTLEETGSILAGHIWIPFELESVF